MPVLDHVADPPAVLQLAAHPLRWRLLQGLARSDRTVRELTGLVGQPQNVVSYHLGRLRDARLVASRRSSADGRDAYYTADLTRLRDLLAATGGALHPGLRLGPPAGDDLHVRGRPRVVFLCTGNSSRSPMAAALARARSGGRVEAHSAGSHPKPLHPAAVEVLREVYGIDLSGHRPTHLSALSDQRFDVVVTVCDRVREVCPEWPGGPEAVHWSIPDPSAAGDDPDAIRATFRRTAADLDTRIGFLLATLSASPPPRKEQP